MAQSGTTRSRMTQFARTMEYFRTAHIDEAQAAIAKATTILSIRQQEDEPRRRSRKEKPVAEQAAAAANNG